MGRSVQLRLASWYVRTFVRRESWGSPEELARRARRIFGSPPAWSELRSLGLRVRKIDEDEFRGELIEPRNRLPGAILYIHGGGYVACSPRTHRPLTAALARYSRRRVYSLDYRRAPEHRFPAAFDDALSAYRWVIQQEPADSVAVAGDSAGGGLTLSILVAARDGGIELPACAVVYSPWADMEGSEEAAENAERCAMFVPSNIDDFANAYLGSGSRRDPRASPIFADLSGLPPILLQVGESELLKADSRRVHAAVHAAGGRAELEIWPHVFHGWQMLDGIMPESRQAVDRSVAFMLQHLGRGAAAGARSRTPSNYTARPNHVNRQGEG